MALFIFGAGATRGCSFVNPAKDPCLPPLDAAPTAAAEKQAFMEAWRFLQGIRPCALYYYSAYEQSAVRKLQKKYAEVCTVDEVEGLFAADMTVDLYTDVVRSKTEWPTHDYSIKSLAEVLGFAWRDIDPSGTASIEWFSRWLETGENSHRQRIIEYNEDDCRAMRVLLDGLRRLPVRSEHNIQIGQ